MTPTRDPAFAFPALSSFFLIRTPPRAGHAVRASDFSAPARPCDPTHRAHIPASRSLPIDCLIPPPAVSTHPHHGLKPVALPPQCLKHVIRIGFPPLHDPPPFSAYLLITRSGPVTRMTHQTVPRAIRRTGTDIYIFVPAKCRHRPAGTDIYISAPSFIRPRRTAPVTSRRYGYIYVRTGRRQAPANRFSQPLRRYGHIYIRTVFLLHPNA